MTDHMTGAAPSDLPVVKHEVTVPVAAAWSQFHASLVRQWSPLLVWGMGPLSLPVERSLFKSLHNFGKNSRTNTVEVLILATFSRD